MGVEDTLNPLCGMLGFRCLPGEDVLGMWGWSLTGLSCRGTSGTRQRIDDVGWRKLDVVTREDVAKEVDLDDHLVPSTSKFS